MRNSGSGGRHCTTGQKGLANRGRTGVGTYARKKKGRDADRVTDILKVMLDARAKQQGESYAV